MRRVLVIGAGACGLSAIKSCKEAGLDVVCFEKSGRVGGLWHYHESDEDDVPSCMKTTVINTSKEMSAFSDFPPPKEFSNYMHNKQMLLYFQMYAENFGLHPHIKLHHEVISVTQAQDYSSTGRWSVVYKNVEGFTVEEMFDGIMICIGHHVKPHLPAFKDQEKFKGRIIHTHSLKIPDSFKDGKVVVIGTGNSGVDAAVEISSIAEQVYLSTRRGFWLVFRAGVKGMPSDAYLHTRLHMLYPKIFGFGICNTMVENILNQKFDHETYGLKPKHRFFSQHSTLNDHLPEKILNGTVIIKKNVSRFVENGIIFDGDEGRITEIDAVVLATGYKFYFPFLQEGILKVSNNKVELYKHAFPPDLQHPTLAIIGLVQPHGAIFPIAENQSRWFAQLMTGNVKLPSRDIMWANIRRRIKDMSERYVESPRHTIQVDYVYFMDDVAEEYGSKPNLLKMAFTDPVLFWKCFKGPTLSYQYRLQGPHSWSGARDAILTYDQRVLYPLKGKQALMKKKKIGLSNFMYLFPFLCSVMYYLILYMPQ